MPALIKPQELHDPHTGVHVAIGKHPNGGSSWVRITNPHHACGAQRVSTIYFNEAGDVVKIHPHNEFTRATEALETMEAQDAREITEAASEAKQAEFESAENSTDVNDPLSP
jgi:hypothetical protein